MNKILVEVSVGELLDKISILEIKQEKIKDTEKLKFMTYKTQVEHHFIKEYYFLKIQEIHGSLLKPHYQKEPQKKILIKTQFYLDLIIN